MQKITFFQEATQFPALDKKYALRNSMHYLQLLSSAKAEGY